MFRFRGAREELLVEGSTPCDDDWLPGMLQNDEKYLASMDKAEFSRELLDAGWMSADSEGSKLELVCRVQYERESQLNSRIPFLVVNSAF
mgnify:FL=1